MMAENNALDVGEELHSNANRTTCDIQQGLADLQPLHPVENDSFSLH
jgi:hypothetical protein